MKVNRIEMLLTQIWLFMFGVSLGFVITSREMVWVPLVLIVFLLFFKSVDRFIYSCERRSL